MSLSVVVPVLDDTRHLATLLSELARDCPGVEVIVADGGSQDGSVEVASRSPSARLVSSGRGRARQMNAGALAATGTILLFLHADTRLPPGAADAVRHALADPEVAYGRFAVRFDSPRPVFRLIAGLMNLRSRLTGICTGDQAIFVRRAAFDAVGGFPEIALMEDIALTRRLKRAGRLAALAVRATTSARKWEREGVARTIALMWILRALYLCGVRPDRLHRWYYRVAAAAPSATSEGSPGSAPVVLEGALTRLAPASPAGHALDAAAQQHGRHGEQDRDQQGHPQPAIRVGTEQSNRDLLQGEPR